MGKKSITQRVGILLVALFIVGFISAAALKFCSLQLNHLNWQIDQGTWKTLAVLGSKIENGTSFEVLQKELNNLVIKDPKFGELIIMKKDGTIVAAKNPTAVGKICPITSVSDAVKGVPLPFQYYRSGYQKSIGTPNNLYSIDWPTKYMFNKFGEYFTANGSAYYIYGTYKVQPGVLAKLNNLQKYETILYKTYRVCFILFWLLLPIWVYLDARKLRANAAAWGILTLLTSVVGWVVYLIARPLTVKCPACELEQPNTLKFCSSCGISLKNCCSQCGGELRDEWHYCGECGHKIE